MATVNLTDPDTGATFSITDANVTSGGYFPYGGMWLRVSGSVTISRSDFTPAAGAGGLTNGLMKNINSETLGFDSRAHSYSSAANITTSTSVSANDCLVLATSDPTDPSPDYGVIKNYTAMHIIDYTPNANQLCPPIAGYDGTSERPKVEIDVAALIAGDWPSYPLAGISPTYGSPENAAAQSKHFYIAPLLGANSRRRDHGCVDYDTRDGYGKDGAGQTSRRFYHLVTDDATDSEKEAILGGMLKNAITWHYGLRSAAFTGSGADGGWGHGYSPVCDLLIDLMGDDPSTMTYGSNEKTQPFFVTQAFLDKLRTGHNGTADYPEVSRLREILSTTTNTITVEDDGLTGYGAANYGDVRFVWCTAEREDGAVTGNVTDQVKSGGNLVLTITGHGFSTGEHIFCRDRQGLEVGDVTWSIRGEAGDPNGDLDRYSPSSDPRYQNDQVWNHVMYIAMINAARFDGITNDTELAAFSGPATQNWVSENMWAALNWYEISYRRTVYGLGTDYPSYEPYGSAVSYAEHREILIAYGRDFLLEAIAQYGAEASVANVFSLGGGLLYLNGQVVKAS